MALDSRVNKFQESRSIFLFDNVKRVNVWKFYNGGTILYNALIYKFYREKNELSAFTTNLRVYFRIIIAMKQSDTEILIVRMFITIFLIKKNSLRLHWSIFLY